jgi:hypothetical protein
VTTAPSVQSPRKDLAPNRTIRHLPMPVQNAEQLNQFTLYLGASTAIVPQMSRNCAGQLYRWYSERGRRHAPDFLLD